MSPIKQRAFVQQRVRIATPSAEVEKIASSSRMDFFSSGITGSLGNERYSSVFSILAISRHEILCFRMLSSRSIFLEMSRTTKKENNELFITTK